MQSEQFDKRTREAADNHHPPYDEQAWAKMEKLLEKHLPEKEDDRRRVIFFLLFALLLGGAAWIFINKGSQTKKPLATGDHLVSSPQKLSANPSTVPENKTTEINPQTTPDKGISIKTSSDNNIVVKTKTPEQVNTLSNPVLLIANGKKTINTQNLIPSTQSPITLNKNGTTPVNDKATSSDPDKMVVTSQSKANTGLFNDNNDKNPATTTSPVQVKTVETDKTGNEKLNNQQNSVEDEQKTEPKNEVAANDKKSAEKKPKIAAKKSNSFFLSVSAGPDVSAAGSNRLGTAKLLFGGGLGYSFHNKFTLRTGFYATRKIYTAAPYEYHPPSVFWTYYPNLEQVNADCKVYEIPVSLSYNFGHSAKQNWFASTGLSSYLMKEETYDYIYKTSTGQQASHKFTLLDKNKHYFSVVTLSGGYQRNLSKSVSLTVEPYAKIPLHGIGYGKVKLNSGGVLVSLNVKPFNSKKKSSSH